MDSLDSMFLPSQFAPEKPVIVNKTWNWKWFIPFFLIAIFVLFSMSRSKEKVEAPNPVLLPVKKDLVEEVPEATPKNVGIAVRDALLKFPMEAEQVAAIVRFTVATLDKLPEQPPPSSSVPSRHLPPSSVPSPPLPPKKSNHFSVKGLELPIEEEIVEAESAGEKQGKINADTNPLVLKMVKDRK